MHDHAAAEHVGRQGDGGFAFLDASVGGVALVLGGARAFHLERRDLGGVERVLGGQEGAAERVGLYFVFRHADFRRFGDAQLAVVLELGEDQGAEGVGRGAGFGVLVGQLDHVELAADGGDVTNAAALGDDRVRAGDLNVGGGGGRRGVDYLSHAAFSFGGLL